jgi:lipopolysaccharide biosynthesis glycosyltransferase
MIEPIKIIVGFDPREAIAYHVFCQSVLEKASRPVQFLPLVKGSLPGYREIHTDGSNTFTYTRFLSPYLMGYQGFAIFADGDMICNDDISKLWDLRDPEKAVQVVKHNYRTKRRHKYLSNTNEDYPRKNWSSVIIWNCAHPQNRALTPEFIMNKTGAFLHRFQWLQDQLVGDIPHVWNWLAVEYPRNESAKIVHYTLGTPCFEEYRQTDMADIWSAALVRSLQGLEK